MDGFQEIAPGMWVYLGEIRHNPKVILDALEELRDKLTGEQREVLNRVINRYEAEHRDELKDPDRRFREDGWTPITTSDGRVIPGAWKKPIDPEIQARMPALNKKLSLWQRLQHWFREMTE